LCFWRALGQSAQAEQDTLILCRQQESVRSCDTKFQSKHRTMAPRLVTFAITQMSCSTDREANVAAAEELVRRAAASGAEVILIQVPARRCRRLTTSFGILLRCAL